MKRIEKEFGVNIYSRDGEICVSGEDENVALAAKVILYLEKLLSLSYIREELAAWNKK